MDQDIKKYIECKKLEFHTNIVPNILDGFSIPTSVFSALE